MQSKSYDRQKILNIETSVGLTKEQYEKKYLFHRLKERFLHSSDLSLETITPEGHENIYIPMDIQTPTQADGLSYEDEQALRMHGAQICFQACNHLKLPLTTAITSLVIYHRFFAKNSFVDYDYREISMASLYLAGKVEETVLKTWYIASTFSSVFQKQKQTPLDIIIKQEKLILRELGFELFRVSDHPHKFIESFYHFIKVDKQVAQKAWCYLNDSYMTDLCVHFPPQVIAAGALYLALRICNHPMPTQPWWILLEATLDQIEQVAATIYNIYEFEKIDFRQARRILAKANRIAYVIQHSEIYGIPEKIEKPLDNNIKQISQSQQSQLSSQDQQQQNNKSEQQLKSPVDKKSIKKKSRSNEKKSKDKKNKSEKKKKKDKDKKKEKKDKKKKSRSRSKSNDKKQSKKDKKKDKFKKDQEGLDKLLKKDSEIIVQQDKNQNESKMEIETTNDSNNNIKSINNNIQQSSAGNELKSDDQLCLPIVEQTNNEPYPQAQHVINDVQQPQQLHDEKEQLKVQLPLSSKQDLIASIKAILKTQQLQKEKEKEKDQDKNEDKEKKEDNSPDEYDLEEVEQLKALKLKMLAKKRNDL
ncbi:unnamed protein product [Paramecium sonneborni]|uniref:Cyclin-like domain-containing protein n=1 Tax=Paramecium sonneborni TaxID=65129 RepID=A0A8S1L5U3_9CILI|nr:unnamed protein product [Paramecium sonneborni]